METVGADMANNVVYLPSMGVCGVVLIVALEHFFSLSPPHLTTNTVSTRITMLAKNKVWSIAGVYGPQSDTEKILFL